MQIFPGKEMIPAGVTQPHQLLWSLGCFEQAFTALTGLCDALKGVSQLIFRWPEYSAAQAVGDDDCGQQARQLPVPGNLLQM